MYFKKGLPFQKNTVPGIIDHSAQQYNLLHLKRLSVLQFICRGTILVEKKFDSNMAEH